MSGYDEKLLGSAPATTKAERQQGYDAALLAKGPTPPPFTGISTPPPHGRRPPAGTAYATGSAHGHARELPPDPVFSKKLPFWRTRKGKLFIGLAVLIIAIVAGVVGGVVGSRKSGNARSHPSITNETSPVGSPSTAVPTLTSPLPNDPHPTASEGDPTSVGSQNNATVLNGPDGRPITTSLAPPSPTTNATEPQGPNTQTNEPPREDRSG